MGEIAGGGNTCSPCGVPSGGEEEVQGLWRGFFEGLATDGRVLVPGPMLEEPPAHELLRELEKERRQSWPAGLPDFDPAAAQWGCQVIALGARLLSDRLVEPMALAELIATGPVEVGPEAHYSADLLLCVLPDLWRLASRRMSDDPLLRVLTDLGARWPLSAVGMPVDDPSLGHLGTLRDSVGLWRVFIDRVIAARKSPWVRLEEVRKAVSNALGPERREAPEYRDLLQEPQQEKEEADGDDGSNAE